MPTSTYDERYFDDANCTDSESSLMVAVMKDEQSFQASNLTKKSKNSGVKASDVMTRTTSFNDTYVRNDSLPDWASLIDKLHLRGLVKQLAQQSELVLFDERRIEICCENRVLAVSSAAILGMEKALNAYFKDAPKSLKIHVGSVASTPARAQATVKATELKTAQEAVAENQTVQNLIKEFDAMVLPNSIRSI